VSLHFHEFLVQMAQGLSMKRSLTPVLLIATFVLGACLPVVELAPTRTSPGDLPQGTQALPPAHTPTPLPPPTLTPAPTPDLPTLDQRLGLLRPFWGDVDGLLDATRYWLQVDLDLDPSVGEASIDGVVRIQYTNPLDERLEDIVLMLWPNHHQYQAAMTAGPALIQGQVVEGERLDDGPGLRFDLPRSLAPGEAVELSLAFQVEIGRMIGLKRMAVTEGMLLAPTFYPLIPRYVEGEWQTRDAPPGGDTTNSDIAFYHLEVGWPADFELVASGVEVDRQQDGDSLKATFISGPMRDIALALGPFIQEERPVGEVNLRGWVLEQHVDDLEVMLDAAEIQLALLSELVGPYPYPELDLVDAPGAYGGIEYPGLVYIGTLGSGWVVEPTVHEVAHQWFYALIGDDQIEEPWLDEAAATYAEVLFYEAAIGSGRGAGFLSQAREIVRNRGEADLPLGLPVGAYEDENQYAVLVYFKGALFFDTLRNTLGEANFKAFLQAYYETYRYGFADAEGFQEVAETTCSCDLDDLFNLWVYEGGTVLELE
jgi:hypothetical protein